MATAPMHRSVAFLRGLWAARPAGRLRLTPLLRQLVQVKQATTAAAPRLSSATAHNSARLPRGPVQAHRHFGSQSRLGAYGRSSLTRPAPGSFTRQEVGLGKARQFSSAPKAAEIMQNAPLLLRAALDSLDCPTKSVGSQASVWPKVSINKDGRISLGPRAAIKESSAATTLMSSASTCAGTSDLFQTEALFDDADAAMELLIPAQPAHMPSFPFELDTHDADRVLSPGFMHVLERQGSYMHQHFKRLRRLLKVLEEHGQLLSVQLISLKREQGGLEEAAASERQVFRVAIRSWSEAELRQALGVFDGDVPPWTDLVDWRRVHSDGDSTALTSSTEQEMDFIFPQFGHSYETTTTTEDYDDCALSSTSGGGRTMSSSEGIGPGSLLRDLDELQSPRFGSSAALPV